jgi:tetratricopeptide (TPR) repeat protein
MLVIEVTLFRFRTAAGTTDRTIGAFFLLTLALPAVLVMVYLAINPSSFLNYSIRDFTLAERLLTEGRVLVFYLKMTIMPSIQELGLYHDDFSISRGLLDPPATLYSLLLLAGLLLLGLLLRRKRPLVSLGILWFFAGHALESTIFPLELAHEHRNYLADYGILLALGSALVQAPLRRLAPVMQTALPVVFLLLFSYTTWLRSEQWSDNINHAIYEARHHPQSHRAVFAAGRIYARLALQGQPDTEAKAFEYLANASRLDQRGTLPEVTMVKLSFLLGRPADPAWYDAIIHKLSNYPETPADIISLRELADCQGGTCKVPEEIMEKIFKAALQQENPETLTVYGYYSINKRGNFNKGLELFNRVVELAPQEPQYWKNLINLLTVMHRFDEAEQRLQGLMATRPNSMGASHFQVIQDEIDTARRLQAAQSATTTGSS